MFSMNNKTKKNKETWNTTKQLLRLCDLLSESYEAQTLQICCRIHVQHVLDTDTPRTHLDMCWRVHFFIIVISSDTLGTFHTLVSSFWACMSVAISLTICVSWRKFNKIQEKDFPIHLNSHWVVLIVPNEGSFFWLQYIHCIF